MDTRIFKALQFAIKAHGDQKRKYTGDPYVTHVLNVFQTVNEVTSDTETLQAALLHDVLEDTKVTQAELQAEFGSIVTAMVVALTDVEKDSGNRAQRKYLDRMRLVLASERVQTIKVADLLDNTVTIVAHDRNFAQLYLQEKAAMLEVLTRADDEVWAKAKWALQKARLELARGDT